MVLIWVSQRRQKHIGIKSFVSHGFDMVRKE